MDRVHRIYREMFQLTLLILPSPFTFRSIYMRRLKRLNPIVNRLGDRARLLELYRLVVVPCVFEKVREKAWRPILFSIPNPIAASDLFVKFSILVKVELNSAST